MKLSAIKLPLLLLLVLTALIACGEAVSDEDQIKKVLRDAAASAEAKDISGVMRHISKDFSDGHSNDYDRIKGLLFYEIMRPGSVRVVVTTLEVHVKKDGPKRIGIANVSFVAVRGRQTKGAKDIVPERVGGYRARFVLGHAEGEWKVENAEWQEVGPAAL